MREICFHSLENARMSNTGTASARNEYTRRYFFAIITPSFASFSHSFRILFPTNDESICHNIVTHCSAVFSDMFYISMVFACVVETVMIFKPHYKIIHRYRERSLLESLAMLPLSNSTSLAKFQPCMYKVYIDWIINCSKHEFRSLHQDLLVERKSLKWVWSFSYLIYNPSSYALKEIVKVLGTHFISTHKLLEVQQ